MIRFVCSHCGKTMQAADDAAGKGVSCPFCHKTFQAPVHVTVVPVQVVSVKPPDAPVQAVVRDTYQSAGNGLPSQGGLPASTVILAAGLLLAAIGVLLLAYFGLIYNPRAIYYPDVGITVLHGQADAEVLQRMQSRQMGIWGGLACMVFGVVTAVFGRPLWAKAKSNG